MKKIVFLLILILYLTSCWSDKEKLSVIKNKKDSIDYYVTGNVKIWQRRLSENKDTVDMYLREILFENNTNRTIAISIPFYCFSGKMIWQDTVINNKIITVSAAIRYYFDDNNPSKSGWSWNSGSNAGKEHLFIKPYSKNILYMLPFENKTTRIHADSLVCDVYYYFDSIHSKYQGAIEKNFYTSKNKLIEIDRFVSLDK